MHQRFAKILSLSLLLTFACTDLLAASPILPDYTFQGDAKLNVYSVWNTPALQGHVTNELNAHYFDIREIPLGESTDGIKFSAVDASHAKPGVLMVHFADGSQIEAQYRAGQSSSEILNDTGVDSHGNHLPALFTTIATTNKGHYDFSGKGNPDDQKKFESSLNAWPVLITGQGNTLDCRQGDPQHVSCHRS